MQLKKRAQSCRGLGRGGMGVAFTNAFPARPLAAFSRASPKLAFSGNYGET